MLLPHMVIFVGGECADDRVLRTAARAGVRCRAPGAGLKEPDSGFPTPGPRNPRPAPMRVPPRPGWRDEAAIVAEVEAVGPGGRVLFAGGDPLEHPRFARLLGAAALAEVAQLGIYSPLCRLTDQGLLSRVLRLGVVLFMTNLYGPDAARHEAVSGRSGGFAATAAAIEALAKVELGAGAGAPQPVVCVCIPVWAGQLPAIAETAHLAFDLGAESVLIDVRDRVPLTRDLRGELQEAFEAGYQTDRWVSVSGLTEADLGEYAAHQAQWLFPEVAAAAGPGAM